MTTPADQPTFGVGEASGAGGMRPWKFPKETGRGTEEFRAIQPVLEQLKIGCSGVGCELGDGAHEGRCFRFPDHFLISGSVVNYGPDVLIS